MRTKFLLPRLATQRVVFPSTHPRKINALTCSPSSLSRQSSSSATPSVPHTEVGTSSFPALPAGDRDENDDKSFDPDKTSELEKPRRRKTTKLPEPDREPAPGLPPGLNVLWSPDSDPTSPSTALPPSDIFEEALNNLLVTLHPQTQHRATYTSAAGPPVEPSLALYCPIEGGDYIVDETVREFARRTGSDVIVLDAVQLAAGEWGTFGKAASAIQLPQNPLHFPTVPPRFSKPSSIVEEDDDSETEFASQFIPVTPMTLHVMAPGVPMRAGRQNILSAAGRNSPTGKVKAFFDELINIPPQHEGHATQPSMIRRPRLVYIRDFPTLAASASTWYPPLLSCVRQHRQGPMARPSSPITSPMTIIFGITPPVVAPGRSPQSTGPQGMMSLLMSRSTAPTLPYSLSRSPKNDYGEDELSEKSRERRLRERLRKWERGDPSLHDEIPSLPHNLGDPSDVSSTNTRPEVLVIGPGGLNSVSSGLPSTFQSRSSGRGEEPNSSISFFRSSILVPGSRSRTREKACRVSRRREINELTIRMGVGAVGGVVDEATAIEALERCVAEAGEATEDLPDSDSTDAGMSMWRDWGNRIESWERVKDIADRAVGAVVASGAIHIASVSSYTLNPTPIPWSAVVSAWVAQQRTHHVRKAWVQESTMNPEKELENEDAEPVQHEQIDEVVQQLKSDPELSAHEQRLLGCIIDSAAMPTSFSHVHLPPHTIDSVRTIVSLPLLHPMAFQEGILKQHSMTGCLLFGPPGTGKTLVVRALAKEAGCRMLAVSPSDVMDMYVGEGEKLVRAVFSLARRLSPCVIFLDEIDALFGARMSARETGGTIAHRGVLTEFMQEMDGLKTHKGSNVMVIGATNRPFDLDEAVLRRLPRRLLVDLPGEKERTEILKILLRDEALADEVDLRSLAKRTDFFSGSDLKHLCVSAALDAVKEHLSLPWDVPRDKAATHPLSISKKSVADSKEVDDAQRPLVSDDLSSGSTITELTVIPAPNLLSASQPRVLRLRNFEKALREITPSSSESLGTLTALRRWNEEFGEGRQKRKSVIWGKGLFGFSESNSADVATGRVAGPD